MPTNRRDFIRTSAGALAAMAIVPDLALGRSLRLDAMPVGLIGAGRQGRVLMGEIQKIPGATIAAVCDPVESRLAAGLRRAPGAQGFADHRALLERSDIQAVFIATPTHLHRTIAEAALAITHGLGLGKIGSTIHPYPTQAEAIRKVGDQYNRTRLSPLVKKAFGKWLSWTR